MALSPAASHGQVGPLSGYSLSVGTASEASPLTESNADFFQRVRLMARPRAGPARFDIAYEHGLRVQRNPGPFGTGLGSPTATTWLDLQWTLVDEDEVTWVHRFDRLSFGLSGASWEATAGRQAVSWATTLFLTPADPFAPFDPSDPFREYRAGIDAARIQYYPGPLSELDLVVRPADTRDGTSITALVRGRLAVGPADLSAWVGVIHDAPGGAVAGSRSVGPFEVRAEASLREDPDGDGVAPRVAVGADRRLTVWSRDLYVLAEYQYDGFGAARSEDLIPVAGSDPFSRGEMQVLGRHETALSASYQVHALWTTDLLVLANPGDGSGLLAPAATYSVGADVNLRGGVFFAFGDGSADLESGLGSEYGATPTLAYLSVTWFF